MKNSMRKKMIFGSALLISGLICLSFVNIQDKKKPWVVPDAAKQAKNPTKSDKESLAAAKILYDKYCKSCHGVKGLGDGPKSKELETSCGDFTKKEFLSQTDGEMFYKSKEGRDDMPNFKKKITNDNDIWLLVNYMRSLGGAK